MSSSSISWCTGQPARAPSGRPILDPGDRVNGVGPRGKIYLDADADWHLFLGDESAIAVTMAMLEALPRDARATAYLDVPSAADQVESSVADRVTWLHRGETPAWMSEMLVAAVESAELPPGRGRIYINGEVKVIAAVQRAALARGVPPNRSRPRPTGGVAKPTRTTASRSGSHRPNAWGGWPGVQPPSGTAPPGRRRQRSG